jgi:nicotinamide riboside kinase
LRQRKHDLYLLCLPDIEWEPDPLRENPDDRWELLKTYRSELNALNVNFVEVEGTGEIRLDYAVDSVQCFQRSINTSL